MVETVAQYRILERIGAGAMGDVFRARDTRVGRTVAIKLLPPDVGGDSERHARVTRDARAAVALSHPNIAALYEVGEDHGRLFLACEFVPGTPLRTVIGGRPLNPRTAVQVAVQIADALAEAHAVGVAHRDLKAEDIVITPKGTAKLLDFGLATPTDPDADDRADIVAAGRLLREMLTGSSASHAPLPSGPGLERLNGIVDKATSADRERQYQSAATFAADLRAVEATLDAHAARTEKTIAPRATPHSRGRAAARWAVAIGVSAILGGAMWTWCDPLRRP